jgi:tRNA A-37 threonylcarbamoyl transferase component Bud32
MTILNHHHQHQHHHPSCTHPSSTSHPTPTSSYLATMNTNGYSQESLDSNDVTPTALFRGHSFDNIMVVGESDSNGNDATTTSSSTSTSTSKNNSLERRRNDNHLLSAVQQGQVRNGSGMGMFSGNSGNSGGCGGTKIDYANCTTNVRSVNHQSLPPPPPPQQQLPLPLPSSNGNNCSAMKAVNLLFPSPSTCTSMNNVVVTTSSWNSTNNCSMTTKPAADNNLSNRSHDNVNDIHNHHHHHNHNHHDAPSTPSPTHSQSHNMSITTDNDQNMTFVTTVTTNTSHTEDEDTSLDISPLPTSPMKKMIPSSNNSNNSNNSNSSSNNSNSRKRTSSDRKKYKYNILNQDNLKSTGHGLTGGGPPPLPKSLFSSSNVLSSSSSSQPNQHTSSSLSNATPGGVRKGSNLSFRLPSSSSTTHNHHIHYNNINSVIESSQSFDSHDDSSNTSVTGSVHSTTHHHHTNDLLMQHVMDPHNQNHSHHQYNNIQQPQQQQQQQQQYNQNQPPPIAPLSSFVFSGSPIEEGENEMEEYSPMSSSEQQHLLHGKKPKIGFDDNCHHDGSNVTLGGSGSGGVGCGEGGEDDHVSSKIRKLNLDCEMDCTGSNNGGDGERKGNGCYSHNHTSKDGQRTEMEIVRENENGNHQLQNGGYHNHRGSTVSTDSFRLHVNTNFDLSDNDDDDDDDNQGNEKCTPRISPNDVMDFTYPSTTKKSSSSSSASSSIQLVKESSEYYHQQQPCQINDDSSTPTSSSTVLFPSAVKTNDMNIKFNRQNSLGHLQPPTSASSNSFSSPPPIHKKRLDGPPSPQRSGRIHTNPLLPPNTPMVPQKAMRRMKSHHHHSASFCSPDGTTPNGNNDGFMDCNGTNTGERSRFYSDFEILGTLGHGSFGTVYKCRSRLDSREYAVKVAKRRAKGNADRDRIFREVRALAKLSDVPDTTAFHVVRYHQAWMEEDKLHIVTELCTSTLQAEMESGLFHGNTKRLFKLLREMLLALKMIHEKELVHLDIKPDNIFVREDTYKLGDFGLVSMLSVQDDVEEGDSRYMCMDLLSGNHSDLTKVSMCILISYLLSWVTLIICLTCLFSSLHQ